LNHSSEELANREQNDIPNLITIVVEDLRTWCARSS